MSEGLGTGEQSINKVGAWSDVYGDITEDPEREPNSIELWLSTMRAAQHKHCQNHIFFFWVDCREEGRSDAEVNFMIMMQRDMRWLHLNNDTMGNFELHKTMN